MSSIDVTVAALDVSFRRADGGGKRVRAFIDALEHAGVRLGVVGVGPKGVDGTERAVASPIHRLKRRALPIQFRWRVESQLSSTVVTDSVLSLTPSTHRWATRAAFSWLDFPDLWSEIARTHARRENALCAGMNRLQASMWQRRERDDAALCDIVSAASWRDARRLGARWLPTPVAESVCDRRRPPVEVGNIRFGMLANYDYPPNRHAFDEMIGWIPRLRDHASSFVVAGYGSAALPKRSDVQCLGEMASIGDFYDQVDVVLAPIELGGGMKVKIVEAMMHGVPVITTSHGAEGLPPVLASECLLFDASSPLASGYRDPRENPAIATELDHFTVKRFRTDFLAAWAGRHAATVHPAEVAQ